MYPHCKYEIPVITRNFHQEKKLLIKITIKIELKQKDEKDIIIVEMLLDSRVTRLVISSEFVRKYKFKKKKLDRPIYIKNIGGIFNYKELIKYIVEVELFYQEHKERMEIDMIRSQKSSIILEMLWLAYYNPEIN